MKIHVWARSATFASWGRSSRPIKVVLPLTRVVALSMFEEPGVAQRMRDAGADIYLAKTGPSDGLLAAIRG